MRPTSVFYVYMFACTYFIFRFIWKCAWDKNTRIVVIVEIRCYHLKSILFSKLKNKKKFFENFLDTREIIIKSFFKSLLLELSLPWQNISFALFSNFLSLMYELQTNKTEFCHHFSYMKLKIQILRCAFCE